MSIIEEARKEAMSGDVEETSEFKQDMKYIFKGFKVIFGGVAFLGLLFFFAWLCTLSTVFSWIFFSLISLFSLTGICYVIGRELS